MATAPKAPRSSSSPAPAAGPRSGVWLPVHRRKLSAIRAPHRADPPDFYFDAKTAQVRLAEAGEVPAKLTAASEKARQQSLHFSERVSWRESAGRCFTNEYWNPLVGLWVDRAGWDFVLDLVMPDPANPYKNELAGIDSADAWYAARRYLHRANAEAYEKARRRVEPAFRRLLGTKDWEKARGRDLLAFAFDRDTDWAAQALQGCAAGKAEWGAPALLVAVCPDAGVSKKALAKYGGLRDVYFIFDMVETLGSRALPLLRKIIPSGSHQRRHVAQAIRLAEELKALGE